MRLTFVSESNRYDTKVLVGIEVTALAVGGEFIVVHLTFSPSLSLNSPLLASSLSLSNNLEREELDTPKKILPHTLKNTE